MLQKFNVPEKIQGDVGNAHKLSHRYDTELRKAIDENREFLRTYLFWIDDSRTLDDAKNSIDSFLDKWEKGEVFAYAITNKENKLIGVVDARIDYANHSAEFGYWLSQNENGKGYLSDILKKFENILLENGIIRLVIKCEVENLSSNNVAKRNGYLLEGTLKKAINSYGVFKDNNIYAKVS